MNKLLKHYQTDVEYPGVSGAEHLQMLQLRDKLAEQESSLESHEFEALIAADRRLVEQADAFYAELSRFIDFDEYRIKHHISSAQWWWYLDVLAQLPKDEPNISPKAVTSQ